ncbi:hypothetical protein BKK81_10410 [Cupriavidus sp. USMAHM13]|uniref:GGDEF domain-containing protein n=1 Tax=Cupriavidus sp. USMAHM13 TaxID=1389192 RepID=UPI0008A67A5A|nr:GGDEF domain-containing protein [Cupriavidus sp. USMAHM13]AOY99625.1 hypothetical protein BKK81_10410 [Cupriavidus sp. USMAHM13]
MHASFDLATILLLHDTSLLAGATGIWYCHRQVARPAGLGLLAGSFCVLAAAALTAPAGNGLLPFWPSARLNLWLGSLGYALLWASMRRISGRRRLRYRILSPVPALWLAASLRLELPHDESLRQAMLSATAMLFLLAAAIEIWHDRLAEPLPARIPLAGCLAVSASIYAFHVISLAAAPGWLDSALVFFLQTFCHFLIALLVTVLVKERVEANLRLAANTDALTGIGNRRWFLSRLPAKPLPGSAVAILDLDHFKLINDHFGHLIGDQVLTAFARNIQHALREHDVFARYGGEEFALYLPQVSSLSAVEIAERLRKRVEAMPLPEAGPHLRLTVSIGIALVERPEGTWTEWLQVADRACYLAKETGRNRVVMQSTDRA